MKKILNFSSFEKNSKLDEGIKDTLVGSIFTSDYEEVMNKIFLEVKNKFNYDNLIESYDDGLQIIEYTLQNNDVLKVADLTFFGVPSYKISLNNEEIECSFLLGRKIYKFLKQKRDEKYKQVDIDQKKREKEERIRQREIDIQNYKQTSLKSRQEKEERIKQRELDEQKYRQEKMDRISRLKSKYSGN